MNETRWKTETFHFSFRFIDPGNRKHIVHANITETYPQVRHDAKILEEINP